MDATLSTIQAMRRQEQTIYRKKRRFGSANSGEGPQAVGVVVNDTCRATMAHWCYEVVDYCKLQRETTEIAMSYLDRFLASPAGLQAQMDVQVYQLCAMTCLYTAVKIHEPEAMDLQLVSNLSRGAFTPNQVAEMELKILGALNWNLNPPTTLSFVRQFLEFLPRSVLNDELRLAILDLTKYQSELAVQDAKLCNYPSSMIAYCALMNSLESIAFPDILLRQIANGLLQSIGMFANNSDCAYATLHELQHYLYQVVIRQPGRTYSLVQPKKLPAAAPAAASPPPTSPQHAGDNKRRASVDLSPRCAAAAISTL